MKKAIVIGATSGIGRALALELVRAGFRVGVTGRRKELLDALSAEVPDGFVTSAFDVTADDSAKRTEELIGELGGMDIFVFCSGTGDLNPELDCEIEKRTNKLNIAAFTRLTGMAYRYFQARGGGHLIAVTSVMGLRGSGAAPSYAASKSYQISYLEGLMQKSAKDGNNIIVTDLRPGSVNTDMMKGEGHFWIASPERAAQVAMKAIRRRKAVQYITPRWILIGWLLKRMPRCVYNKI